MNSAKTGTSCEKKQRGRWGEIMVDKYMEKNHWQATISNKIIRGGEIDRVYVRSYSQQLPHSICVSEIKTSTIHVAEDLVKYTTIANISRFIKKRQMQNLKRFGEHYAAQLTHFNKQPLLHARLFLVVRILAKDGLSKSSLPNFPGKICTQNAGYWILALDPDVAHLNF